MLEIQNSFPSGICIKKPKPRFPRELGLPLSLTGLGPAWETKLILGKGKAAPQPSSSKEVASAVSQVGQSPANPLQELLPPAAAVSHTYKAQWQPLPVNLGKKGCSG